MKQINTERCVVFGEESMSDPALGKCIESTQLERERYADYIHVQDE
jgi:hypothetical protein